MQSKNFRFILFPMLLAVLSACSSDSNTRTTAAEPITYVTLNGETMGTYYRVSYGDAQERDFQREIDNLLEMINLEVSTYINTSTISQFNSGTTAYELNSAADSIQQANQHFLANFKAAKEIYEKTEGYFDPTVMPLVNFWGFGYTEKRASTTVDSTTVDSLQNLVGFNKIHLTEKGNQITIAKSEPHAQLDFSAIAKGYGVDEIGRLLREKGIDNYLVDIGGEVLAKGLNVDGNIWRIGISLPQEGAAAQEIQTSVLLQNRAIATSGNYRNFYEVDGVKYSHTINPITGYPERNTLLSASVFAKDCMTADAYATAFMVMGIQKAMIKAANIPEIEAYFIYSGQDGEMKVNYTEGLAPLFSK
jgi:thiamine biosynthesis lipoprotein